MCWVPDLEDMEPSSDATGWRRGIGGDPDLTLVPGGGGLEKRIFVVGWGSQEPLGYTLSLGRWGSRLSAGGGKGNGDATERWNVLFGLFMLSSLPFIHSLIHVFIQPTMIFKIP